MKFKIEVSNKYDRECWGNVGRIGWYVRWFSRDGKGFRMRKGPELHSDSDGYNQ